MGQNKILDSSNGPESATLFGEIQQTLNGLPLGISGDEIVLKVTPIGGTPPTIEADINIEEINGVAPNMGTGASGTGTLRIALATDGNTIQGAAADNAVASGSPVQIGGVAVTSTSYSPAYTAGDAAKLAVDKDSGGILSNIRKLTRVDDAISADPKQYSNAPSNFTIATADATVFTLAVGEKGFIQNLHTTALAVKRGASASTTSLNQILRGGTAQDDGIGAFTVIDDWVGVVSVAAMTGSPRFIAWKL
jgi:hypothetical protein